MRDAELDEIAGTMQASISLLLRRLRQTQITGELTFAEAAALSRLDRGGPATSADLARRERMTPQSMGATLTCLERRELIERRADPDDGRRVLLSVTSAGRKMVKERRGARTTQMANALANFSADELEQLKAAAPLLERLARGI